MNKKSFYAPAARSTDSEILSEKELIETQRLFTDLLGALTGVCAIINRNRQIVFANYGFLEFLGLKSLEPILGKRPGEVISCVNFPKGPSGCGTSEECKYCGSVSAILDSQRNNTKSVREARISSEVEGKLLSWDLKVTSSPLKLNGETFYCLTLQDISYEKKLQAIERVFFHDLLNTAGGLNGMLTMLKMGEYRGDLNELIDESEKASQIILDEIMSYRQLRAAETGDIQVKIENVSMKELLQSAVSRISFHEVGQNKSIIIKDISADVNFETDRLLLQRVIINLLKNALEATGNNGVVELYATELENKIIINVKNSGIIHEDVRLQIFQRSFSTKDKTRGIGTYSVRLITENYLKGKVSFTSNDSDGTIFRVELNKTWYEADG